MKKVVYTEIDEEITSIYDRVKNSKQKDIYLVVPPKAILFQSAVNLKILKTKLREKGKRLLLITTDRMGCHLAEKLGIPVHQRVEVEAVPPPAEDAPETRITPIQARRNEVVREQPRRSAEKKVTIGELIRDFRERNKKGKPDGSGGRVLHLGRPNRKFLAIVLLVSIGLFMLIGYIALPGAQIAIRPKFDHIDHTVNVLLADKRKNQNLLTQNKPHVISSEQISTVTKQTKVFNTTSKEFEGVNATGKITIINAAPEEWPLKGGTRFQTENGLVFHIKGSAIVPPATQDEAGNPVYGKFIAPAEADPFDRFGNPIGERGNIGPATFTIPGLSKYNQRLIWGESEGDMTGGVTRYKQVVKEEDIEAAKKQIEDNLVLMAKEDLRMHLEEMNKLNHSNLVLLDDRRYFKTELLELRVSDDLEGSEKQKFEVFAKIRAEGMAYDFNQLFTILKKELRDRAHPDMQIREDSISPETITYEVIDENEDLGQIKITASIQGIEEYVIEPSSEAGQRFSDRVKEKVVGLPVEEAEALIGNLPEVDVVRIKTWPIWISRMPRVPENIEVKLMEKE